MAIILKLKNINANDIIDEIYHLINDGTIRVWEYDSEGDFTHSSSQWNKLSWFRHYISNEGDNWDLKFGIIGNKNFEMSRALYGIYHGRFAEMLLTYFDNYIERFIITPMKDEKDLF